MEGIFFQCGWFRVHGPIGIMGDEYEERRLYRQKMMGALNNTVAETAKTKDKNGNYIQANVAHRISKTAYLYIFVKNGCYDIFVTDDHQTGRIDITPSELNAIIQEARIIEQQLRQVTRLCKEGVELSYVRPQTQAAYYQTNSPDINPVRGSPYTDDCNIGYERE